MDAVAFFDRTRRVEPPTRAEGAVAVGKTLLGAALVWGAARLAPEDDPLLRGWIGLFGAAWILLFGIFHLLSIAWRSVGVDASRLWRSPVRARSLGDFWGNRWNLAFRDLARRTIFGPLRRRWGTGVAVGTTFLVSGIVHDVVFSVPARGGHGLCTAYFALQAVGVAIDRSPLGARLGIRGGWRGWLYAMAFAAPGSFFLFHPAFVERNWVPFLERIGAL
jgi:alginate O-acetyltransferase complex protein AlgI